MRYEVQPDTPHSSRLLMLLLLLLLERMIVVAVSHQLQQTVPVSVGAKLSFVEPGCRWAHSPSPSKAPGDSYQGTMKTSMLKTSRGV